MSLPPLWSGERRRLLAGLVLTGCGQAGAAATVAGLLSRGVTHPSPDVRLGSVAGLVGVAMGLGWLRCRERVLAERLGQEYVHAIRGLLLRRGLSPGRQPALGVAVARNTNDLASVRTWVALGVAPLAVAVPLVLGATVVLALLHPFLALALAGPLSALGGAFAVLSGQAYRASRRLRRARGRLAAHLADTLVAAPAIRAAGGRSRERRRLLKRSAAVVDRAVMRAAIAGRIRGAAAAAGGLALAAVVGVSLATGLNLATLAAAVTVVAFVAGPVQELGRVVEYRQASRAAERILTSFLAGSSNTRAREVEERPHLLADPGATAVGVTGLVLAPKDDPLPCLHVPAGARVLLTGPSCGLAGKVLAAIAAAEPPAAGEVVIDGVRLSGMSARRRRALVGYAARAMPLERGTVLRVARYRNPECPQEAMQELLDRVGLSERIAELPDGLRTRLKYGGGPLDTEGRALLLLVRAALGSPALLLLDHIDADLGPYARTALRDLLAGYPGVVIAATHDTGYLRPTHRWDVDGGSNESVSRRRCVPAKA